MKKNKNKNMTIKILAIFIASILWTYVMSEVNPRTVREFRNIKVTLLNEQYVQQNGLYIMEPREVEVTVRVAGRRSDVFEISAKDIIAQIDLWGYSEGTNRIPVEVKISNKVEILDISPKNIPFTFDGIITKELPVSISTSGDVQNGYTTGVPEARPRTVLIKGPRSWVNSVASVIANVDVSNSINDIVTNVPIKAIDDRGREVRDIEKEPNTIDITVPIYRVKRIPIEPELQGSVLAGHELKGVSVNPLTVQIRGYNENIREVAYLKTSPIDISNLSEATEVEVELILPEGVELLDQNIRPVVSINVEQIIEKTLTFSNDDISFLNINTDLEIDNVEDIGDVEVTVRGLESNVNTLVKNDIRLYVDLANKEEGEHRLEVVANTTRNNIEITKSSPQSIIVTLLKKN